MDYTEAVKKVQTKKPKQNYLVIELSYDKNIVLPFQDGISFMAALQNAEQLTNSYSKPKTITGLNQENIKTTIMSHEEYEQIKIAALLRVSIDEVKQFELNAT